ncbi:unnamed protein product [Bursaphelenchus xylophilus]|uniref:(pine wood nematode) hypothetical protein n=1 Tax=Bursaphelenchus xylophilus TaxID=6326 RepID=A0A1I7RIQ1_BURXY|nr:unnamed protein product [Bursaphelenchus xylophilus]CAG9119003.1 unnamed protein product [Bursaphelenchus xylophilus]
MCQDVIIALFLLLFLFEFGEVDSAVEKKELLTKMSARDRFFNSQLPVYPSKKSGQQIANSDSVQEPLADKDYKRLFKVSSGTETRKRMKSPRIVRPNQSTEEAHTEADHPFEDERTLLRKMLELPARLPISPTNKITKPRKVVTLATTTPLPFNTSEMSMRRTTISIDQPMMTRKLIPGVLSAWKNPAQTRLSDPRRRPQLKVERDAVGGAEKRPTKPFAKSSTGRTVEANSRGWTSTTNARTAGSTTPSRGWPSTVATTTTPYASTTAAGPDEPVEEGLSEAYPSELVEAFFNDELDSFYGTKSSEKVLVDNGDEESRENQPMGWKKEIEKDFLPLQRPYINPSTWKSRVVQFDENNIIIKERGNIISHDEE